MLRSNYDKINFINGYNILRNTKEYILSMEENHIFLVEPNFTASEEIKKIINKRIKCKLQFKNKDITKDIDLVFYYNHKENQDILLKNINKIITRLWNLLLIFSEKKTNRHTTNGNYENPKDYKYHFFLYNNVRKANKNKSGSEYLDSLYSTPMRCANIISGYTQHILNIVVVSRLEESIGLLTHEFIHSMELINGPNYIDIDNVKNKTTINENEIITNAFATIFHSYLTSKELGLNLKKVILNELIHSINHSIRLNKIMDVTMEQIYQINITNWTKWDVVRPLVEYNQLCSRCGLLNNDNASVCAVCELPLTPIVKLFTWKQKALLYEYIIGRMLFLINIDIILNDTHKKLLQNFLSRRNGYEDNELNKTLIFDFIKQIHTKNDTFLSLYNHIKSLNYLDNCNNCKKEDETICGHMIMQYFLLDPIEIPEDKKEINLYGGYKQKYLKYKTKYLELKKIQYGGNTVQVIIKGDTISKFSLEILPTDTVLNLKGKIEIKENQIIDKVIGVKDSKPISLKDSDNIFGYQTFIVDIKNKLLEKVDKLLEPKIKKNKKYTQTLNDFNGRCNIYIDLLRPMFNDKDFTIEDYQEELQEIKDKMELYNYTVTINVKGDTIRFGQFLATGGIRNKQILDFFAEKILKRCTIEELMTKSIDGKGCYNTIKGSCDYPAFAESNHEYVDDVREWILVLDKIKEKFDELSDTPKYLDLILGATGAHLSNFKDIENSFQLCINKINNAGYDKFDDFYKKLSELKIIKNRKLRWDIFFPLSHNFPKSLEILNKIIKIHQSGITVRITNRMCSDCHRSLYYLVKHGIEYIVEPEQNAGQLHLIDPEMRKCYKT